LKLSSSNSHFLMVFICVSLTGAGTVLTIKLCTFMSLFVLCTLISFFSRPVRSETCISPTTFLPKLCPLFEEYVPGKVVILGSGSRLKTQMVENILYVDTVIVFANRMECDDSVYFHAGC
jgi:hypothetical protein